MACPFLLEFLHSHLVVIVRRGLLDRKVLKVVRGRADLVREAPHEHQTL